MAYKGEEISEIVPLPLAEDRELWMRQPEEPMLWYNRFFLHYVTMGTNRSLFAAFQRYLEVHGKRKYAAIADSWRYWSRKWSWERRAEAYDAHALQQLQDQIEDERYQMFRRHREQAQAWGDASMAWLNKVQGHRIASGALALRAWLAAIDVETRSLIPPQILKLFEMTDAELQQFYESLLATAISSPRAVEVEGDQDRREVDAGQDTAEGDSE